MKFSREWAMPNSKTFSILPISNIIHKYIDTIYNNHGIILDPFANDGKLGTITNDLNPEFFTDYHLDALDFLKLFEDNSVDAVLYDPPYSPRQVSECYKQLNMSVNMQTTQSTYWMQHKNQISRIIKPKGIVITCSWNSNGMGKSYGFELKEVLLVAHGGWHNDTIVTVEEYHGIPEQLKLF